MSTVITFPDEGERYVAELLKERFASGDVKIYCMNLAGFGNAAGITFANLTANVHPLVYSSDPPDVADPLTIDGSTAFGYAMLSVTRWRAKNHGTANAVGLGWVAVDMVREMVVFVTPFTAVFGVSAGETIDVTFTLRVTDESQA